MVGLPAGTAALLPVIYLRLCHSMRDYYVILVLSLFGKLCDFIAWARTFLDYWLMNARILASVL